MHSQKAAQIDLALSGVSLLNGQKKLPAQCAGLLHGQRSSVCLPTSGATPSPQLSDFSVAVH
jgi:hypothetical protein